MYERGSANKKKLTREQVKNIAKVCAREKIPIKPDVVMQYSVLLGLKKFTPIPMDKFFFRDLNNLTLDQLYSILRRIYKISEESEGAEPLGDAAIVQDLG